VHEGIIDAGYKGPLTIKIYNFGDKDVVIKKGTAAAQCKIHKVYKAKFTEISKAEFNLTKTIRGHKGFGSSDKK
jgi:dUTPase